MILLYIEELLAFCFLALYVGLPFTRAHGCTCVQWRFYIELHPGRDPLQAPPPKNKKKTKTKTNKQTKKENTKLQNFAELLYYSVYLF